jgi:hypothetical protein
MTCSVEALIIIIAWQIYMNEKGHLDDDDEGVSRGASMLAD